MQKQGCTFFWRVSPSPVWLGRAHIEPFCLPEEISLLTELQSFDASHNHLMTLPSSFGKLQRLSDLVLNDNHLLFLPDAMTALKELQTFDVENNFIGKVPEYGKMLEVQGKIQYLLAMVDGRQSGAVHMTHLELTTIPDDIIEWPGKQLVSNARDAKKVGVHVAGRSKHGADFSTHGVFGLHFLCFFCFVFVFRDSIFN